MLIRNDEGSVTLTPFGSVIRAAPPLITSSGSDSWIKKLRALFASLFR